MADPQPTPQPAAHPLAKYDSTAEFIIRAPEPMSLVPVPAEGRHGEIEAKQAQVGSLLTEAGADGLLLLDPANIAWLCGTALHLGVPDPSDWPAVFLTPTQRWLIAGNTDSQRIFDIHLDGLGFQLKEWQWHGGRERLLAELCVNKRMASDRVVTDCVPVGPTLRRLRSRLTEPERGRLMDLGAAVSHALEATGRALTRGESEDEVAGQLSHRLLHRGVTPVALDVVADDRAARHRRPGVTRAVILQTCTVMATACRDGLYATAARTVSIGPKTPELRQEYDAACRVMAAQAAASRAGLVLTLALEAGRKTAAAAGFEHAWRDVAPGHLTGWQPVERAFLPGGSVTFDAGWPVVWQAGVGRALCADTYVVTADAPVSVTPPEVWPVKRIHVHGEVLDVPDVLVRD